jgi:signal transduction histidine kinase
MCLAYILVAAATEVVGYNAQRDNLHHQLETRARNSSFILAAGSGELVNYPGSQTDLNSFLQSVKLSPNQGVHVAEVHLEYNNQNSRCYSTGTNAVNGVPCKPVTIITHTTVTQLGNGDVKSTSPIFVGSGTAVGEAMVVLSGSSVQQDLNDTLKQDLLLRGIGLIIFVFLTLVIAQYILGPLTTLAEAADELRHGRLGARVPFGGHTELATMADAFNDMASALEQRIRHLSFLASAAPVLPRVFRDHGDAAPTLREFCFQLDALGAGLVPRETADRPLMWYDTNPEDTRWHGEVLTLADTVTSPTATVRQSWALMLVPVLGDTLFVTARDAGRPFTREEQQVITNFAYQLGVAADNAALFEAQQEALQVKDQFLSIVSHELRTPLTTIKGYAQMLRRKLSETPDGLRFAVNIDAQVSRLSRLVDDLLDVTRFSRGQFELRRQRLDLRPLLEDVAARFRVVAPDHEFRLDLDSGSFDGTWDRDRLEQVMNNLVGNAVKYSPDGGTVTISTRHEDGHLVVAVRDEGIGIAEEDQKHLFERFYRGRAEGGSVKGLGLGLYVTQRIVEAHGGNVGVRSRRGEGSEFYFSLPLAVRVAAGVAPQP